MAKAATVKGVLYALQYAGELLCRWPQMGVGSHHRPAWSLEPSGTKVPPHVADQAMAAGGMAAVPHPRAVAAYRWLEAA